MAKATAIILLVAASAAVAAAHPGLGKGMMGMGMINVNASNPPANMSNPQPEPPSNATATGESKTITFTHPFLSKHLIGGSTDLSQCQCKDDCTNEKKKKCKSRDVVSEKCADETTEVTKEECTTKCFNADKVITIGKGRRLLSAASMQTLPHMAIAKAAMAHAMMGAQGNANATEGAGQQKICRNICKMVSTPKTERKCKKETKKEEYDCKDEVVSTRCVKNCQCPGGKNIMVKQTPDFHAMAGALLAHHLG